MSDVVEKKYPLPDRLSSCCFLEHYVVEASFHYTELHITVSLGVRQHTAEVPGHCTLC